MRPMRRSQNSSILDLDRSVRSADLLIEVTSRWSTQRGRNLQARLTGVRFTERLDIVQARHQLEHNFIRHATIKFFWSTVSRFERNTDNISRNSRKYRFVQVDWNYSRFGDAWSEALTFESGPNLFQVILVKKADHKSRSPTENFHETLVLVFPR